MNKGLVATGLLLLAVCAFVTVLLWGSHDTTYYVGTVKIVDAIGGYFTKYLIVFEDGREVVLMRDEISRRPQVGDVMIEIRTFNWFGQQLNYEWGFRET